MAVKVALAFDDTTNVPYFGFVQDGRGGFVVDLNGQVPGSAETLQQMKDLFGDDVMSWDGVFDLFGAAYGSSTSGFAEVPYTATSVIPYLQAQIAAGQGGSTPARQAALDAVAIARNNLNLDSAAVQDGTKFDPELGTDVTWLDGMEQEFLAAAGWKPYPYDESREAELAAALKARLANEPDEFEAAEVVVVPVLVPVEEAVPTPPPPTTFAVTDPLADATVDEIPVEAFPAEQNQPVEPEEPAEVPPPEGEEVEGDGELPPVAALPTEGGELEKRPVFNTNGLADGTEAYS